ncbi:MAG: substrate-binding domain-containing protein [Casimicrobiaceae bacterium]
MHSAFLDRIVMRAALPFIVGLAVTACTTTKAPGPGVSTPASATVARFATIPPNKDTDLKLYRSNGKVESGPAALAAMPRQADLVLWLAGNQFFAMDDVVHAFQVQNPGTTVGLITLPPGLLLEAIERGGWTYQGRDYPGTPDIYASVNLGHLKTLKAKGLASDYRIYMHNEMVLLVARGNPKSIRGIADVGRPDVRTSMPNPVNEGIMQFYGRKVLERHGLWEKISGGKTCVSCATTPNNWFTAVHHRETPDRILAGTSDTGIVWLTEAIEAQRAGSAVDAVQLPPEDSLRDEVAYVVTTLAPSAHRPAAQRYLDFLSSAAGQEAYAKFGFVKASAAELQPRPVP